MAKRTRTDKKHECSACGAIVREDELSACLYCDEMKCFYCDMGDDVPCVACEEAQ